MKHFLKRRMDSALDLVMCGMMNGLMMRHHLPLGSRAALEEYINECESLTPEQFYNASASDITFQNGGATLRWLSPVRTPFPENNYTHVDLYPCERGWTAPTVLMLHALMSTSDTGYKEWAKKFHAQGWNACFIHLPYHYSRVPRGHFNGELAIGPDLVRTAEGLRQGVIELRQLMRHLRTLGCPEFGLWATSYGGWIGALLSFVEADFRFITLMSPIVNVHHAVWKCPASIWLRSQLRRHDIEPSLVERHYHLSSPMHNRPLCGADRVILTAGSHDLTALPEDVEQVHKNWPGSEYLLVPQGHFGYRIMPENFQRLLDRGLFK
jgi:hypothetical protein